MKVDSYWLIIKFLRKQLFNDSDDLKNSNDLTDLNDLADSNDLADLNDLTDLNWKWF